MSKICTNIGLYFCGFAGGYGREGLWGEYKTWRRDTRFGVCTAVKPERAGERQDVWGIFDLIFPAIFGSDRD